MDTLNRTADVTEAAALSEPPSKPDRSARLRRLLRYTGVNLTSLTLDYAIFLPLTHATDLPVLSSIVAYIAALALNYRLSRLYVFGDDGGHKGEKRLFAQFMATGLLGLVLTAAVTGLGIYWLALKPAIAKTIAVLICFVVLYIVRSRLVFTPVD
ncbi:GtrA family protein [Hyphomicrobium sp.]|uniref:GtrA family protein n=1 Tax=Hyphomicrobium sp. TaxID=82 RepID=UPI003F710318